MLWDKERERQCLELQISTTQDKEQLESRFRIIEPVGKDLLASIYWTYPESSREDQVLPNNIIEELGQHVIV